MTSSLAPIEAAADRDDRDRAALNNDLYTTTCSTQPMASEQHRKRRTSNRLSQENIPPKKPRLTGRRRRAAINFSPAFWDNLTEVSLSTRALRELDRRNSLSVQTVKCTEPVDLSSHHLALFARHGGPDLRHLRAYPEPSAAAHNMTSESSPGQSQSRSTQQTNETSISRKTKRSSAYNGDFEQHLLDHNIYPERYRFLGGLFFIEDFQEKNKTVSEGTIMRNVIPTITGNSDILNEGHLPLTNLESMTKEGTVKCVPDFFDGAHLGAIDKAVIQELDRKIIPTRHVYAPVVPNFFLEAKPQTGGARVAELQARFDGAYGSRGMHALQNYGKDQPEYDRNAYTFSSTYHDGTLKLYAHHVAAPSSPNGTPQYHTTQIDTWGMTGNVNTFRRGAAALRNARDLARRHRDRFIQDANARSREARSVTQDNEEGWQDAHEPLQGQIADVHDDNCGDDAQTHNAQQSSQIEPITRSKRARNLSSPDNSSGQRSSKSRTRIPLDQQAVEEPAATESFPSSSPGTGRQTEAKSQM